MSDTIEEKLTEEQKEKDFEALVGLEKFYKDKGMAFKGAVDSFAKAVKEGKGTTEQIKDSLHKHLTKKDPDVSKDQFYKMLEVAKEDRLSDEEIEKRRQLSEKAVDVNVDYTSERYMALADWSGIDLTGSNERWLGSFFEKPQIKYREENLRTIQQLFGLDKDNKPKGLSKEELDKERNTVLNKRLDEYKTLIDAFDGVEFTDEIVVNNFAKLSELGVGMGMEWKNILLSFQNWGTEIEPDILKKGIELNHKAYYLNNVILPRMTYIQTSHYQFGAENAYSDYSLMAKTDDNMLAKTIMAASTLTPMLAQDVIDTFARTLGISKDDRAFIYDKEGNVIPFEDTDIFYDAIKTGKPVLFFKEGQREPLIANLGNIYKMPPEINQQELTPEFSQVASNAMLDHDTFVINNSQMSPERKDFELELSFTEYGLRSIASGINDGTAETLEHVQDNYKDSLAKYAAMIAIQKKLGSADVDAEIEKQLVSKETIDALTADLKGSEVLDRIYNDMLKQDGGLNAIAPEKVFESFVKNQTAINKEKLEKEKELAKIKEEKQKVSREKIKANIKSFNTKSLVRNEHWGITAEDKHEAQRNTKMSLTLDRASLQTIAYSLMLDKGFTIEEAMKEGPEYSEVRKKCAEEAKELVMNNEARKISEKILDAAEKTNKYMAEKLKDMKTLSPEVYLSDKYKDVRVVMTVMKDLMQETNNANKFLQKKSKEYIKNHPTSAVPNNLMPLNPEKVSAILTENNSYSTISMYCTSGLDEIIGDVQKGSGTEVLNSTLGDYIMAYARRAAVNELAKQNPDLTLPQILNSEKKQNQIVSASIKIVSNPGYMAISSMVKQSKNFANKILVSAMDGTLINENNCKMTIDENGEFNFSIDSDKIIKDMKEKHIEFLGNFSKKAQEAQMEKEGPKGPDGPAV